MASLGDRVSGILLHITSLPSRWGIGDLGPNAYQWVDFLVQSGQTIWQVLPLGPTGWGNSPYMCFSAFAGNPLVISPDQLHQKGWLDPADWESRPEWTQIQQTAPDHIDFSLVIPFKEALLQKAWIRFQTQATSTDHQQFDQFCHDQQRWLEDYTLFRALKSAYGEADWLKWPDPLKLRDPEAIEAAKQTHREAIQQQRFRQFVFEQQWQELKHYANQLGIRLVGDLPIYVAGDSADVWANRSLFQLDPTGQPLAVAGVPPDYFSKTGQLWGNPLYNWEVMQQTGYTWYLDRLQTELQRFDYVRIDHFRGFAGYFSIPAGSATAEQGEWIPGPATALFDHIQSALDPHRIIAEDLGVITPDVNELRDRYGLKGMKILQFGFDTAAVRSMFPDDPSMEILSVKNPYLPCNYEPNYVAYTGTHDNNTIVGWFQNPELPATDREALLYYLDRSLSDYEENKAIHWDMIRLLLSSTAAWAIVPWQDVLGLGESARMNRPGSSEGNWGWRCVANDFTPDLAEQLTQLALTYARISRQELDHRKLG